MHEPPRVRHHVTVTGIAGCIALLTYHCRTREHVHTPPSHRDREAAKHMYICVQFRWGPLHSYRNTAVATLGYLY